MSVRMILAVSCLPLAACTNGLGETGASVRAALAAQQLNTSATGAPVTSREMERSFARSLDATPPGRDPPR